MRRLLVLAAIAMLLGLNACNKGASGEPVQGQAVSQGTASGTNTTPYLTPLTTPDSSNMPLGATPTARP